MAETVAAWASLAGVIVSIGTIVFLWARILTRIQEQLKVIGQRIEDVVSHTNRHIRLTGFVANKLSLDDNDRSQLIEFLVNLSELPSAPTNPFTREETRLYNEYIDRLRQAKGLTRKEVKRFKELAEKLREERPMTVKFGTS